MFIVPYYQQNILNQHPFVSLGLDEEQTSPQICPRRRILKPPAAASETPIRDARQRKGRTRHNQSRIRARVKEPRPQVNLKPARKRRRREMGTVQGTIICHSFSAEVGSERLFNITDAEECFHSMRRRPTEIAKCRGCGTWS